MSRSFACCTIATTSASVLDITEHVVPIVAKTKLLIGFESAKLSSSKGVIMAPSKYFIA